MELSNAAGFGPEPFAKIGAAALKVKLLPLLKRNWKRAPSPSTGFICYCAATRRGATTGTTWREIDGRKIRGRHQSRPALASLAIGGVNLRDATLIWDDCRTRTLRHQ